MTQPSDKAMQVAGKHFWSVADVEKLATDIDAHTQAATQSLKDENARLVERNAQAWNLADGANADLEKAMAVIDGLEEALERIEQWADAYPLSVFPKPDFKKAHELLTAGGITLDAISADNMRHCLEGVGNISRTALATAKAFKEKVKI